MFTSKDSQTPHKLIVISGSLQRGEWGCFLVLFNLQILQNSSLIIDKAFRYFILFVTVRLLHVVRSSQDHIDTKVADLYLYKCIYKIWLTVIDFIISQ